MPASARDVVLRLKNLVSLHVNVEGVADGDQPAVFLKRDDGKILWPGSTMGGHHFVGLEPGGYSIVRFGLGGEEQQLRKIQIDSRPRQEISLAPN